MITFEQFQQSGVSVADLGPVIDDEGLDGMAGRHYLGCLYIEHWIDDRNGIAPANGPTWLLTLGNGQTEGALPALERALYDWACLEGYCDADC